MVSSSLTASKSGRTYICLSRFEKADQLFGSKAADKAKTIQRRFLAASLDPSPLALNLSDLSAHASYKPVLDTIASDFPCLFMAKAIGNCAES